jgi:hypothetical protein
VRTAPGADLRMPARRPCAQGTSLSVSLACALAAAVAGCPDPVAPRLSAIEARVFAPSCTFSSCHSADGHAGDLVLEAGKARAQLVGHAAAQEAAAREGLLRVVAGQPEQSFLLVKLRAGTPERYGRHMPDTGGQLDADVLDAIAEWIRRGANDD